jgi:hypothetical protein
MYCWYCGTKLPGAAAFCHRCGQSQAEDAAFDPQAVAVAPGGWSWSTAAAKPGESLTTGADPAPLDSAPPRHDISNPTSIREMDLPAGACDPAISADTRPVVAVAPSRIPGLLGIACGAVVVAGSFGPWFTAQLVPRGPIQFTGTDWDGGLTLGCGLAAVACLVVLVAAPRHGTLGVVASGAFFLAALVGIAAWSDAHANLDELRRVGENVLLRWEIGWGLQAVTFGGLAGTILAMAQALQARRATA